METSRRDFLKGSAAALGVAALGVAGTSASAASGAHHQLRARWTSSGRSCTVHAAPLSEATKIRQTWIKDMHVEPLPPS